MEILVVVDQLSKQTIFIPTHKTINFPKLTELFLHYVFSKHRLPLHIISNWGSEFILRFTRSPTSTLNMRLHFISGYHSQVDSQTERVN